MYRKGSGLVSEPLSTELRHVSDSTALLVALHS